MDYFRSYYNKLFGPTFKAFGFRKKDSLFLRVTNDIVQYFYMQRYGGGCCSLNVGFVPLCMNCDRSTLYSISRLSLGVIAHGSYRSWYYDQTEEDIRRVLEEQYALANEHLLDLFTRVTNTSQLCLFIDSLKVNYYVHSGVDIYSCLKCGLYDEALNLLNDLYELNEGNIQANVNTWRDKRLGAPLTEEEIYDYIDRSAQDQAEIAKLIDTLKKKDERTIDFMLKQNEEFSLNALLS